MSAIRHVIVAATCAAVAVPGMGQVSRSELKSETRAANKAGQIPHGEASFAPAPAGQASTRTRAERKAQTRADIADGDVSPGGEAFLEKPAAPSQTPGLSRTDVKAETRKATKTGNIPHAED